MSKSFKIVVGGFLLGAIATYVLLNGFNVKSSDTIIKQNEGPVVDSTCIEDKECIIHTDCDTVISMNGVVNFEQLNGMKL